MSKNFVLPEKQVCIHIDRDYITGGDVSSRIGLDWEGQLGIDMSASFYAEPVVEGEKVRFRILDDDGEVYYGGWLLNDDEGTNQLIVLKWAERDAGATEIQVKINSEWKTEIG